VEKIPRTSVCRLLYVCGPTSKSPHCPRQGMSCEGSPVTLATAADDDAQGPPGLSGWDRWDRPIIIRWCLACGSVRWMYVLIVPIYTGWFRCFRFNWFRLYLSTLPMPFCNLTGTNACELSSLSNPTLGAL